MIGTQRKLLGFVAFWIMAPAWGMELDILKTKKTKGPAQSLQTTCLEMLAPEIEDSTLLLPYSFYPDLLHALIFKSTLALDYKKKLLRSLQLILDTKDPAPIISTEIERDKTFAKCLVDFFNDCMGPANFNEADHQQFLQQGVNSKRAARPFAEPLLFYAIRNCPEYKPENGASAEAAVRFLVCRGANCDQSPELKTPFALACAKLSPSTLHDMITHKAYLFNRMKANNPLYQAALAGRIENVRVLLEAGARGEDVLWKEGGFQSVLACLEQDKTPKNGGILTPSINLIKAYHPLQPRSQSFSEGTLKRPRFNDY